MDNEPKHNQEQRAALMAEIKRAAQDRLAWQSREAIQLAQARFDEIGRLAAERFNEQTRELARLARERMEVIGLEAAQASQERLEALQHAASQLGNTWAQQRVQLIRDYQPLTDALLSRSHHVLSVWRPHVPRIQADVELAAARGGLGRDDQEATRKLAQTVMDSLQLPADEHALVTSFIDMAAPLDQMEPRHETVQTILSYVVARHLQLQEQTERRWRYITLGVALFAVAVTIIGILVPLWVLG